MERIVLEVDDKNARYWRYASDKKRNEVETILNRILGKAFDKESDEDFILFMREIQDKVAARGLTEEIVNEILNDKD